MPQLTHASHGPSFTASPDGFDYDDVTRAIAAAAAALGPDYALELENLTEGGFRMTQWPHKPATAGWKTLRLGIDNWPWLPLRDPAKRHVRLVGHEPEPHKFDIILKAFDAPAWSEGELDAVRRAMEDHMRVAFSA